jgi:4-hydroxy-tetrahydrodipicolinate synthase/2-dehydro-3-deoxy-phosphogluconate/2-dehydro-3-deoxy-6-phosphogalactonate aldolase
MGSFEEHYRALSSAVSPIPVFVYNNPWAQGRALTPEELNYLNEKKLINGVVDSSRDLGSVYKLLKYKDRLTCIIADTKLSMPGILFGCPALASAIGNVIPELFVEMYNAVQEKNISKAIELELEVFRISEPLRTPEIGALHEALAARGLPCGITRLPVRTPSDKEKEIIHSVVKDYKL